MALLNQTEYREVLRQHAMRYPAMQPQDAVKLAYQGAFGGGHLIKDETASLTLLRLERVESPADAALDAFTPIGAGRARMELGSGALLGLSSPLLNRMFIVSANRPAGDAAFFESLLRILTDVAAEEVFPFQQQALTSYLALYRAKGYPMVSHSEPYRAVYRPRYRVVDDCYAALLPFISMLAREDYSNLPPLPRGLSSDFATARLSELFPELRISKNYGNNRLRAIKHS